jgi:hypothetical protein
VHLGKIAANLVAAAALATVCGCATTNISNFDAFQPHPLEKASLMPSEDALNGGKLKVVVFALDETGNRVAREAHLGLSMAGNIEALISEKGGTEIIDRNAAAKLQQEIALAEMSKAGSYEGPRIADYALSGNITDAGFSKRFVEATQSVDKKGRVYRTSPGFRYTADVAGTVKIYELPSMKVVKTISLKDNKSRSEETRSSQNYLDRDDELVRGAGADAVNAVRTEMQNFFAKKGYILDERVADSTNIVQVSLGAEDGVKQGDTCEIFTYKEFRNNITGKKSYEKVKVCEAKVTNLVADKTAWLTLPGDYAARIRLGDEVKVVYSKNFMDVMKSTGSVLNSIAK